MNFVFFLVCYEGFLLVVVVINYFKLVVFFGFRRNYFLLLLKRGLFMLNEVKLRIGSLNNKTIGMESVIDLG